MKCVIALNASPLYEESPPDNALYHLNKAEHSNLKKMYRRTWVRNITHALKFDDKKAAKKAIKKFMPDLINWVEIRQI